MRDTSPMGTSPERDDMHDLTMNFTSFARPVHSRLPTPDSALQFRPKISALLLQLVLHTRAQQQRATTAATRPAATRGFECMLEASPRLRCWPVGNAHASLEQFGERPLSRSQRTRRSHPHAPPPTVKRSDTDSAGVPAQPAAKRSDQRVIERPLCATRWKSRAVSGLLGRAELRPPGGAGGPRCICLDRVPRKPLLQAARGVKTAPEPAETSSDSGRTRRVLREDCRRNGRCSNEPRSGTAPTPGHGDQRTAHAGW